MNISGPAKKAQLLLATLVVLAIVGEGGVRIAEALGLLDIASGEAGYDNPWTRSQNRALLWELDVNAAGINADGLRDRDHSLTPPPDTIRIVALGDSVTFGRGVLAEEGYTTVLERLLDDANPTRRHEVLNLGVGGYNTLQEAERYRVTGRKYAPDVVLLAYVLNDPQPAGIALRGVVGLAEATDSSEGAKPPPRRRRWSHLARAIDARSREVRAPRPPGSPPPPLLSHRDPEKWRTVQKGMAALAAQTRRDGTPVVVVIVPMWVEFDPYPYRGVHAQVAKEASKHGFAVLDPLQAGAFEGSNGLDLQLTPGDVLHPNAEGHRRLAVAIERFLSEQGRLSTARP
jgi:lysophospholipase L1-like esterase